MSPDPASPEPAPPEASPPAEAEGALAQASPYRNLWAPLVVIPALIVMVPVLIAVLFGGIGGKPKTVASYLDEIQNGGANERKQALFGLTRRLLEWASEGEEAQAAAGIDREELMPRLERAWESVRSDEPEVRFVLAATLALLDHPEGVPRLAELLALSDAQDPEGRLRHQALYVVGARGDARGLPAVLPLLRHPDPGLRAFAVISLQRMPIASVRGPLVEALGDEDLVVRGNAAIALARLGDGAGGSVLVSLLDPATYAEEHRQNPRRFSAAGLVGEQRLAVLEALGALRRPEDLPRVQALARDDADLNVRGAAKRLERDWELLGQGRN